MIKDYKSFCNELVATFTDHPEDVKVFAQLVEKYELEEVLKEVPVRIVSSKRATEVAPSLVPSYNYPVKVEHDGNNVQLSVVIEELIAYGEDNIEGIGSVKSTFVREVAHYRDCASGLYVKENGFITYDGIVRDARLVEMMQNIFEESEGLDEIITEAFFRYCPWEMDYIIQAMLSATVKCEHFVHFTKVMQKMYDDLKEEE